ncbi:MAG: hypothetical protein ACJ8M1_11450 [Chthoniobacterales bacterium]
MITTEFREAPSWYQLSRLLSWVPVLLWLGFSFPAAAQPDPNDLQQRILAQAQSMRPDDYAFTRTIRTEQTSSGKTEKKVTVEKFDPTKPADQHWILLSVDGAPPTADALSEFRKESAKRRVVPGYARLGGYFGSPATVSSDAGRTVFHFAALPQGTVRLFDTDVSQNATADASVNETAETPFVEKVRITLKPMRLKLVMKLQQYESTARYRIGPEGKPLVIEQISDMTGSGMGKEGKAHTVATYSDYKLVGR